ncbi:MAG: Tetratricopeptide repeat protein [Candidatus Aminicenantes bacterium ADurb.Bin508]|nr:MAG: Tetratricopeptide repeat protein [Candidatus Aminicenantes bacterium ADurb.Bin508]HNX41494.1 hypothetical protein [Candidatus Aminicenantes bacterium]HPB54626.1 hypothetical protein [Candidatus Aminicenantes bacterium]HPS99590.1 hypothetical protein [Candidatus Aminicenantes bacterium]
MRKGIRGTTILILLVLMGAFLFAQPQTKSPTDQELIDNGFKKLGGGNLAGAVGDFTKAIQLNPQNSSAFLGRALARKLLNDLNGALQDCNDALKFWKSPPPPWAVYQLRASIKMGSDDLSGALADYNDAIALNGERADLYYCRGNLKVLLEDLPGSLQDYDKAISLKGDYPQAFYERGMAKIKGKQVREGCLDLIKARDMGLADAGEMIIKYCP